MGMVTVLMVTLGEMREGEECVCPPLRLGDAIVYGVTAD